MSNEDKLKRLVRLASKLRDINKEVNEIEAELKEAKEKQNELSAVELPELMAEIGIQQFKLSDGTSLVIKPIIVCRVPKGKEDIADDWLDEHGHSGMMRTKFDVGKINTNKIVKALDELGIDYEIQKIIHHMTLDAWAREMEREELVIPEDIFSVFRSNKTVIE